MTHKNEIRQQFLTGERALFKANDLKIIDSIFDDGESPLKESRNIEVEGSQFRWKYPLWYAKHVSVKNSNWFEMARAGVWYSEDLCVENAIIEAPKNFRRCKDLTLRGVDFTKAEETLWHCDGVTLQNVHAKGDYFGMNCSHVRVDNLRLVGNYSFDGVTDVEVHGSTLMTKDAFWNSDHVTVYDSYICGEYLGWNAKNLTLINCTIESLQGMCYLDNLVMKNCKLINTTLAFEYTTVDAEITGRIESVFNPKSGTIKAETIGELCIQKDEVDPEKTKIICSNIETTVDTPTF